MVNVHIGEEEHHYMFHDWEVAPSPRRHYDTLKHNVAAVNPKLLSVELPFQHPLISQENISDFLWQP